MKMKLKSILAAYHMAVGHRVAAAMVCALCAVGFAAFAEEPDCVQLWKDGPYFATSNLGTSEVAEHPEYGALYTFDDAGTAVKSLLGDEWRVPSKDDLKGLLDSSKCTQTKVTDDAGEFLGYTFTGAADGYSDKSIFLPAAGYGVSGVRNGAGSTGAEGNYWPSELEADGAVYPLFFSSDLFPHMPYSSSTWGFSVRAVKDPPPPPEPVEYLDWDDVEKKMTNAVCKVFEVVTNEMATFEAGKTYVVLGNVTNATAGIVVNGTPSSPTRLILCDGAELVVKCWNSTPGLTVTADKALVICGQVGGTGKLTATGGMWCAGIGSSDSGKGGMVTINGGVVTATGGQFGAGIGGGEGAAGGTVTINGGTVTATGDVDATGIGGGDSCGDHGTVTFGTKFSVLAGDDAASAQPVPQDDYVNDHSARYVHIAPPPPPEVSAESDEFAVDLRPRFEFDKGKTRIDVVTWSATAWGAVPGSKYTDLGYTNLTTGATGVIAEGLVGENLDDCPLPEKDGEYVLKHTTGDLTSFVTFVVSGFPAGSGPNNPWYVGTPNPQDAAAWVDKALTNLAPIVADIGLPDATNALDLVALTNGMARWYAPILPLDAILLTGNGTGVLPAKWLNQNGETFRTLAEALAAGSTTVTPIFETDDGKVDPPKAIVEEVKVEVKPGETKIVTATMKNGGSGAIQSVGVEGLAELAASIKTNVELDVTAKSTVPTAQDLNAAAVAALNGRTTVGSPVSHYAEITLTAVAEDGTETPITELDETLAIEIPWTFAPNHAYKVVRSHEGVAKVFPETEDEDGEYVEFDKENGLIIVHSAFFSDYAIVDFELSTVQIKVPETLPEGVESITVTTNGVPVDPVTSSGGVSTYEIDVGVPVEVVATAKSGYGFTSEGGASTKTLVSGKPGDDVTVDVGDLATMPTLGASLLYPSGDGAFKPAARSTTYYGTLIGTNGVEGTIKLKMTKPNKKDQFNLSATVKTLVDRKSYSFKAKKVTAADGVALEDGALAFTLVGSNRKSKEHALVVTLGGDSLTGAFDGDFLIDGARHVFSTKGDSKRAAILPFVGTWTGVFAHSPATAEGATDVLGATFSAKFAKSGSVKVKVCLTDGKTLSCTSKAEVGADGVVAVPVTVWRSVTGRYVSLGFRLVFAVDADGNAVCEATDIAPVRSWVKKTGETEVIAVTEFLVAGLQTVTAKEFKSYAVTVDPVLEAQLGPITKNQLALAASTGRISGTLKFGKVSGKASGIVIGGIGIGTVTVKLDGVTAEYEFCAYPPDLSENLFMETRLLYDSRCFPWLEY